MVEEDHLHLGTTAGLEDLTVRTLPTERHARTFHFAYLEPLYSRGARIRLDVEPVTVGRSSFCTVRLQDPRVSARHALFQFTERGVLVTDLGSTNGILVDGHRVQDQMRVTTTAIVAVGRTSFRLLLGDELSADDADDSASSEGRVLTALPPRESLAKRLRKYLSWAGVTRAELSAEDETRRALTFHDLRHTGITWRAVRGDEPLKVQRAAGHDDLMTTQRYINEAETFEGVRFGEPFPPVALSALVGFGQSFGFLATATATGAGFSQQSLCPQGESNPR
jgi:pSer/pThr/pTyr-binding forkhead associated (FHA) protein